MTEHEGKKALDRLSSYIAATDPGTFFEERVGAFAALAEVEAIAAYVAELEAEVARCHTRLEVDHHYVLGDGEELQRVEIPPSERKGEVDGIEARDATIHEQDRQIDKLRALIAGLGTAQPPEDNG
ncbi:hypothetical protein [Pseudohoeflea coraliihabitans]|uniref:Uncharacterized protein n=1 Tax=Pseudohoeflea coraliihabitans TaxID=2860393 RepID=A0ABS6WLP2_9HYPH|nr:hypothetical protein [Pseudohoeflea sp. DP4N28-3]MBW3096857.1 hypothetical protein [Pseudohoeflea sp. DP4N28-3]